jgi:hypothetical protein
LPLVPVGLFGNFLLFSSTCSIWQSSGKIDQYAQFIQCQFQQYTSNVIPLTTTVVIATCNLSTYEISGK